MFADARKKFFMTDNNMSLGYVPRSLSAAAGNRARVKVSVSKTPSPMSAEPDGPNDRRWLQTLFGFNAILCLVHFSATLFAANVVISFPVTVFETKISECVRRQFQCQYQGEIPSNSSSATCTAPNEYDLSRYFDCDTNTIVTSNHTCPDRFDEWRDNGGSPLVSVYELTLASLTGNPSADGRAATRGILIGIEGTTALFHFVYTLIWARMLWWDADGRVRARMLVAGGVPARWYEYAFTASIMSFFISNSANVFDLNALLAIALGTFALMYFGVAIELLLYQGRTHAALVFLYIPGGALFLAVWLPSLRQTFGDVARLSCVEDGNVNVFMCTKSCFGAEVPIVVFIFALLWLFAVFPLIALSKIYLVGGWEARWTGPMFERLDRLCCAGRFVRYACGPLRVALKVLFFLAFAVWGLVLAIGTVAKDSLWPLGGRFVEEYIEHVDEDLKWRALLRSEFMYAIASATSKLFLFAFFLFSFAGRDW